MPCLGYVIAEAYLNRPYNASVSACNAVQASNFPHRLHQRPHVRRTGHFVAGLHAADGMYRIMERMRIAPLPRSAQLNENKGCHKNEHNSGSFWLSQYRKRPIVWHPIDFAAGELDEFECCFCIWNSRLT